MAMTATIDPFDELIAIAETNARQVPANAPGRPSVDAAVLLLRGMRLLAQVMTASSGAAPEKAAAPAPVSEQAPVVVSIAHLRTALFDRAEDINVLSGFSEEPLEKVVDAILTDFESGLPPYVTAGPVIAHGSRLYTMDPGGTEDTLWGLLRSALESHLPHAAAPESKRHRDQIAGILGNSVYRMQILRLYPGHPVAERLGII